MTCAATRTTPAERLGERIYALRREAESRLLARTSHQGRGFFVVERILPVDAIIGFALRACGLYGRARRAALDIRVVENEVRLRSLPGAFDGFRLLQVTDLHCDIDPGITDAAARAAGRAQFDLCVLTGDYHNKIGRCWTNSIGMMRALVPHLGAGPLAVLGNHDFLEKVPALEDGGLRVLLNENVRIDRGGQSIWICGVDDPHYFRTHDLAAARAGVPDDGCAILLAHSPEIWREAAAAGFALQLSGHTHGGQLCLPGGVPVVWSASVPRRLVAGAWTEKAMPGYTSRGTGCCGVAARLNCPPEVTVHVLRCG